MRSLYAVLLLVFVTACATPPPPLSELKPAYPKLDVALLTADDDIYISLAQPDTSHATTPVMLPPGTSVGDAAAIGAASGLIAGLIIAGFEAAERADAAKDILPVKEALGEVRFGAQLRQAMLQSLQNLDWTTLEDVQVIDVSDREALPNYAAATDAPGVLTIASSNHLSRNAATLIFSAYVSIAPKATETYQSGRVKMPPAAFTTTVGFEVHAPVEGRRRVDFLPTWAANDAELIRAAALQAEPILAELILRQMQEGNVLPEKREDGKWDRRFVHMYGIPQKDRVQILETRPDGEVVRAAGGSLRFLASEIRLPAPLATDDPLATDPVGPQPNADDAVSTNADVEEANTEEELAN